MNNYFTIADHDVCIRFADSDRNSMSLLPSFHNFRTDRQPTDLFFTLTVDDSL